MQRRCWCAVKCAAATPAAQFKNRGATAPAQILGQDGAMAHSTSGQRRRGIKSPLITFHLTCTTSSMSDYHNIIAYRALFLKM